MSAQLPQLSSIEIVMGESVMGLERKMFRGVFAPGEVVQLKQYCFTPGRVFEPGKYIVGELPDIAFEMGLVEQLPPVKGKSAEIKNTETPPE
ncbi:hypothetical protein [Argonema galeatum]|uniref:hypothetical protein n=2 Tax=Argonema TaxID=2942761 RepID=UPI003B848C9E